MSSKYFKILIVRLTLKVGDYYYYVLGENNCAFFDVQKWSPVGRFGLVFFFLKEKFWLMFLKGGFSAVVNELIGFRISRRSVTGIATEEFQLTPDW